MYDNLSEMLRGIMDRGCRHLEAAVSPFLEQGRGADVSTPDFRGSGQAQRRSKKEQHVGPLLFASRVHMTSLQVLRMDNLGGGAYTAAGLVARHTTRAATLL